jgi:osmotically-inducible protein OsmY
LRRIEPGSALTRSAAWGLGSDTERARKVRWILGVAVILSLMLLMGGRSSGAQQEKISDKDITRAVESALYLDELVAAHLVDVATADGVVTLSGSVDNLLAREHAAKVAESIRGVRSVVNRLGVACIVRTDDALEHDVKTALAEDPATNDYRIRAAIKDGTVTLTGEVDTWEEKRLAGDVVMGVVGVHAINNDIDIGYEEVPGDQEILGEVNHRLELDPYVYEGLINAEVNSGEVILSGVVGSAAEKTNASADAWVTGVTAVDATGLKVEWWAKEDLKRESRLAFTTDAEVKQAVEDALRDDPRTSPFHFSVSVEEREVVLTGVADNLVARSAAGEDAWNSIGVSGVTNFIKVRPEVDLSTDRIAQNVERALKRDPLLERYTFTPIVRNQKVYLYGTVDTFCDRQRAIYVTSRVWGVAAVSDNLKVSAAEKMKSDDQIKKDIERQFFWSFFVSGDDIQVSVKDGIATLAGVVTSWQELKAVIENAFQGTCRRSIGRHIINLCRRCVPTGTMVSRCKEV